MLVKGSCHCGAIAYEAQVETERVGLCHCSDCQMFSGSAFRISAPTNPGSLRFLRGVPKVYVKTADSGRRRRQAFCDRCGSPVYSSDDVDDARVFTLRTGCLEQKASLKPQRQIWCQSALDWTGEIAAIPGDTGQRFRL